MKGKGSSRLRARSTRAGVVRASVSFPAEVYRTLAEIAKEKKVSVAWVVRDAAERYLAERWPLFRSGGVG